MSTERERLVKLLDDAYKSVPSSVHSHRVADVLLAAGVTLPPEPPALVTPAMIDEVQRMEDVSSGLTCWTITLNNANALVAAAIRRAVERRVKDGAAEWESNGGRNWHRMPVESVLALFGLESP